MSSVLRSDTVFQILDLPKFRQLVESSSEEKTKFSA
jgi:hypothetical protein